MVKHLANPFYYPFAVLVGGIILITGTRFLSLPQFIILPTSIAVTTVGASVLKTKEEQLATQKLRQDLTNLKKSAQTLVSQAESLKQEAHTILSTDNFDINLLVDIQQVCDNACLLPVKIEQLSQKLSTNQALLSIEELQQQLAEVKLKLSSSSEVEKEHLERLSQQLEKNIQLAQTGKDTRQAQIINLQLLIQETA